MMTLQSNPGRITRGQDGSVVVEVVLAAALLATAGVGLSQLVARSQVVGRQSDQRLAGALIAGNVIERLKTVDVDQIESQAEQLQQSATKSTGYDVRVTIDPITVTDSTPSGSHVRVEVIADDSVRVVMHDWRLRNSDEPAFALEKEE